MDLSGKNSSIKSCAATLNGQHKTKWYRKYTLVIQRAQKKSLTAVFFTLTWARRIPEKAKMKTWYDISSFVIYSTWNKILAIIERIIAKIPSIIAIIFHDDAYHLWPSTFKLTLNCIHRARVKGNKSLYIICTFPQKSLENSKIDCIFAPFSYWSRSPVGGRS